MPTLQERARRTLTTCWHFDANITSGQDRQSRHRGDLLAVCWEPATSRRFDPAMAPVHHLGAFFGRRHTGMQLAVELLAPGDRRRPRTTRRLQDAGAGASRRRAWRATPRTIAIAFVAPRRGAGRSPEHGTPSWARDVGTAPRGGRKLAVRCDEVQRHFSEGDLEHAAGQPVADDARGFGRARCDVATAADARARLIGPRRSSERAHLRPATIAEHRRDPAQRHSGRCASAGEVSTGKMIRSPRPRRQSAYDALRRGRTSVRQSPSTTLTPRPTTRTPSRSRCDKRHRRRTRRTLIVAARATCSMAPEDASKWAPAHARGELRAVQAAHAARLDPHRAASAGGRRRPRSCRRRRKKKHRQVCASAPAASVCWAHEPPLLAWYEKLQRGLAERLTTQARTHRRERRRAMRGLSSRAGVGANDPDLSLVADSDESRLRRTLGLPGDEDALQARRTTGRDHLRAAFRGSRSRSARAATATTYRAR